jgi:hypothetical protein
MWQSRSILCPQVSYRFPNIRLDFIVRVPKVVIDDVPKLIENPLSLDFK